MQKERKIIYWAGFLFTVAFGFTLYINSSFLSLFIEERYVGIIFTVSSVSAILGILAAPKIFKKIGGYNFLILTAFLNSLTFLGLSILINSYAVIIAFILGFTFNVLVAFSLDELLKIFSKNSSIGKIRGVYLTITSLAMILSQVLTATFLGGFSFQTIYFVSFLVMVLFLALCYMRLKNIIEPIYDKIISLKYVGAFFKNKNLSRAFGLAFLVQFFYSWMIIYTPIYLFEHLGFSLKEIGIIFSVMLLPFLFMPIYTGRLADKIGEGKISMWGFLISSLATLSLFFIKGHEVWIWALLLFCTRVGKSTAETMADAYFYKHVKAENEELVGVYHTAAPMAYVVGPVVASIFLAFVPSFNFIYVVLSAIMLIGVYLSSRTAKSDI